MRLNKTKYGFFSSMASQTDVNVFSKWLSGSGKRVNEKSKNDKKKSKHNKPKIMHKPRSQDKYSRNESE